MNFNTSNKTDIQEIENKIANQDLLKNNNNINLSPLYQNVKNNKIKYFLIIAIIGLINNAGYVMVGAGSQKISERFDTVKLMGLFQFALILFSGAVRIINIKFLIKIQHRYRIYAVLGISSLGYIIISISCSATQIWGFYLSLFGSIFCGSMSALGEGVNLGFLKSFPSELVGGWSSGTGLAGIFGSFTFIALDSMGVPLSVIFGLLLPMEFIYFLCFMWYDRKKIKYNNLKNLQNNQQQNNGNDDNRNTGSVNSDNYIIQKIDNIQIENQEINNNLNNSNNDAQNNIDLNCESFYRIFPKIYFYAINIGLVYFFEYAIITGFANKITDRLQKQNQETNDFFVKEGFAILNFCYQLGVFCSRSSLSIIKVQKIWILTIFQGVNFVLYFFFAFFDFMSMAGLIPIMLWVGFMGGASYVNVMYQVVNTDNIANKEKELSVNIVSVFNDIGILSASLFSIFVNNYILNER